MARATPPTCNPLEEESTMRNSRRRRPIPQHEFGFTPDTFNLFAETTLDGERLAHERAEADDARRRARAAQVGLFANPERTTRHD